MTAIAKKLERCEIENWEYKPFVPFRSLESVLTRNTIAKLLEAHQVEHYLHNEILNSVLSDGLRVFAILTVIGDIKAITSFIQADYFSGGRIDSRLPLDESSLAVLRLSSDTAQEFFRKQWRFLAPVFRDDQSHRLLDDRTVLPFRSFDMIRPQAGGFSDIYRVVVEASHHRILGATQDAELICKHVKEGTDKNSLEVDFDHELHILSSLRLLKHPNIVKLVSAYTKGSTYNFLLPVAEGDLKDLLSSSSINQAFGTNHKLITSLWGLSSAIQAVHTYIPGDSSNQKIGCHYDIKPRNILYKEQKLWLTDFGLSRLRNQDDGSCTIFKRGEGSYLAPECEPSDQAFKPGRIGRASDMWSFGCVLADILAYVSAEPGNGPTGVSEFTDSRKIKLGVMGNCYHFHGVQDVNPAVTEFLSLMKQHPSWEVTSLACLIEEILQFDQEKRPKAWQTTQSLFHLAQRHTFNLTVETLENCGAFIGFELNIELQRLRIWGDVFGITSDPSNHNPLPWWSASHTHKEYQSIEDLLFDCLLEAKFIAEKLQYSRSPSSYLCFNLQRLLDSLWDMQTMPTRQVMTSKLEEALLGMASVEELQQVQTLPRQVDEISRYNSSGVVDGLDYRRIAHLATMREISIAMEQQTSYDGELSIDKSLFSKSKTDLHHHYITTALDTHQKVLIENVKYERAWVSRVDELLRRINAIASLRSSGTIKDSFPVLRCRGYYHEDERFRIGIVYELPEMARDSNPESLVDIIKATSSRNKQPSLSQKFKLASSLASHILSFHMGGWLHKNVSAYNIICFPEVFDNIARSLSSPYFIGLNHSRQNDENAYSVLSNPDFEYQHPKYLQNAREYAEDPKMLLRRFRQEFDYYSLGLVLLEISLWKPLSDITKKISGTPEQLLKQLLETHIDVVKSYMGDIYGDCVKYCLTCYVEDSTSSPEEIRENFSRSVAIALSNCLL